MPDRTASASLGPMPLIANQPLEHLLLEGPGEAEQRQRVLADVRVDAQHHLAAGSGRW